MKFYSLLIVMSCLLWSCTTAQLNPIQNSIIAEGVPVYTQVNMWIEARHGYGTNYKRGALIPVNSKVTISSVNSKVIKFKYQGVEYYLINVAKYTLLDISGLMERTFKKSKVSLSKFNSFEKKAIEQGEVLKGMSKASVIISRGYPPSHKTGSLDFDAWRYWESRFNTTLYNFKDGKVSAIVK